MRARADGIPVGSVRPEPLRCECCPRPGRVVKPAVRRNRLLASPAARRARPAGRRSNKRPAAHRAGIRPGPELTVFQGTSYTRLQGGTAMTSHDFDYDLVVRGGNARRPGGGVRSRSRHPRRGDRRRGPVLAARARGDRRHGDDRHARRPRSALPYRRARRGRRRAGGELCQRLGRGARRRHHLVHLLRAAMEGAPDRRDRRGLRGQRRASRADYSFHQIITDPTPDVLEREVPALVAAASAASRSSSPTIRCGSPTGSSWRCWRPLAASAPS